MFPTTKIREYLVTPDRLFSDQRKATRVFFNGSLRYRFRNKPIFYRRWDSGQVLDFSQNGARLVLRDSVPHGTPLDLRINLPDTLFPLHFLGKIVWIRQTDQPDSGIECGVSFKRKSGASKTSPNEKWIHFLANQMCHYTLRHRQHLKPRNAETLADLEAAYHLVYREYVHRGYCLPSPAQMHYSFYCLLPQSRTFLLEKDGKLLSTLSLIADTPCGLPMESIYAEEVAKIRRPGRYLSEVSLLALDRPAFNARTFSLTNFMKFTCILLLFKYMFDSARHMGVTDLLISVHPKHELLYRYLKFKKIGPVKSYPGACGKPAMAFHLDILEAEQRVAWDHGVGTFFFHGETDPPKVDQYFRWNARTVRYMLVDRLPLWIHLPSNCREYLKQQYPGLT
ncbi:MAG: PilZ domain-containing protein [Candidatus Omnitrophica bacterium]|nr:PilZ domain-containing protein [Candidatus Omnitrophota bacterium]